MKIAVAIDSFKGSLTSIEAGNAVKRAAMRVFSDCDVTVCPLADGGEGTVEALYTGLGGEMVTVSVTGPLGNPVSARYCILRDNTAVMEMASAAGITLVSENERNPLNTTTLGVGEMIKDAILRGCRNFIIGIGGSATNDGGIGMLSALGFRFLDKNGKPIEIFGRGLQNLYDIKTENVMTEITDCSFNIASDVKNVLCGKNGCSAVYGPQKGATPEIVSDMDKWLNNYAEVAKKVSSRADENFEGVGAAGGLGFAFRAFLKANLIPGVELVLMKTKLENFVKDADLVITGEGRLDSQTVMGKAPIGVAKLAKKYGKRVIAFSGCVSEDAEVINEHGIDAYFPIMRGVVTLEEALKKENAEKNLEATAYQVFKLIK
ncbi:MAG: glycerate kinase [Clostridia bacterium]|nr:glycerate kinase [Clostridia bacterium]